MIKLALVIPGFQSDASDWCIPAFTNLARELSASVELHVFALRYPHRKDNYRIGRTEVHALGGGAFGGPNFRGLRLVRLWQTTLRAIKAEHLKGAFNAVIGIWATESGWLATRAARDLGIPSLAHLAGGELAHVGAINYGNRRFGLAAAQVNATLRHADKLTVPSSYMAAALPAWVPRQKVVRWPLGVDSQMFTPSKDIERSEFTFASVGSLIPVKDHAWLLHSFAALQGFSLRARTRLRIAGTGPLKASLQKIAADYGIADQVDFAGEVAHDDLPAFYRNADAFALSSWHESQCMAALEAMSCGLPWISPPVGALADLASAATPTGLAVLERTPAALAREMAQMVEANEQTRRAWASAARQQVERDYQLQTQTERLLNLIEKLL